MSSIVLLHGSYHFDCFIGVARLKVHPAIAIEIDFAEVLVLIAVDNCARTRALDNYYR